MKNTFSFFILFSLSIVACSGFIVGAPRVHLRPTYRRKVALGHRRVHFGLKVDMSSVVVPTIQRALPKIGALVDAKAMTLLVALYFCHAFLTVGIAMAQAMDHIGSSIEKSAISIGTIGSGVNKLTSGPGQYTINWAPP